MSLVSILVPCYNVERYLEKSIKSIINQTLIDIEIIIIDDGSTDNSLEILKKIARNDSRIILIHQENMGYGITLNKAISICKGEYIGIVEPDDYIELNMYESLYKCSKNLDLDVCMSGFYLYNSKLSDNKKNKIFCDDRTDINLFPEDKVFSINDYPEIIMQHASIWSKIYKRKFILDNDIKFDESPNASYQDFPFFVQVVSRAKKVGCVHNCFYHWRFEQGQNSSTHRSDSRLLFMVDQCENIKKILENYNLYNKLKKYLYKHFLSVNLGFYKQVNLRYKREYFYKLKKLFNDIDIAELLSYELLSDEEKKFFIYVKNNKFLSTISYKQIRKFVLSIHLNGNDKYITVLGKTFYI